MGTYVMEKPAGKDAAKSMNSAVTSTHKNAPLFVPRSKKRFNSFRSMKVLVATAITVVAIAAAIILFTPTTVHGQELKQNIEKDNKQETVQDTLPKQETIQDTLPQPETDRLDISMKADLKAVKTKDALKFLNKMKDDETEWLKFIILCSDYINSEGREARRLQEAYCLQDGAGFAKYTNQDMNIQHSDNYYTKDLWGMTAFGHFEAGWGRAEEYILRIINFDSTANEILKMMPKAKSNLKNPKPVLQQKSAPKPKSISPGNMDNRKKGSFEKNNYLPQKIRARDMC